MAVNRFKKAVDTAIENTVINSQPATDIRQSMSAKEEDTPKSEYAERIIKKISQKEKISKRGATRTVYLPTEVDNALSDVAKRTGKGRSVIVSEILREVLIGSDPQRV